VPARLAWIYAAFWELSTCRTVGMSMGPIPWTAVNDYARAQDVISRERFLFLVRRMDDVLREDLNESQGDTG